MKTLRKALPFLIAASSISGIALADAPQYTLTDMGAIILPNTSLNLSSPTGAASGSIYNSATNETHAFYFANGISHDIGSLGGSSAQGIGINSASHLAGYSSTSGDQASRAFYYNGTMHDLGTLGGTNSSAYGINSSNRIVGDSDIAGDTSYHAFFYNGTMHDLGTLGGAYSSAVAINDANVITGNADLANNETHAFMYNGSMHDLGTLGGSWSTGYGVSSNNLIAGESTLAGDSINHAFIYDGAMHDLGTLGGSYSSAFAVNKLGWALGTSEKEDGNIVYFFYDGKTLLNLDTLLNSDTASNIFIDSALGLNDSGDIFLHGVDYSNGDEVGHMYRLNLSAVPVPASAWLYGSCLTGLVGLGRKFKS